MGTDYSTHSEYFPNRKCFVVGILSERMLSLCGSQWSSYMVDHAVCASRSFVIADPDLVCWRQTA